MKISDLLPEPGRPIAYFPSLRRVAGSTNATLLLCQLIYWHGKQHDPDGWIRKRIAKTAPPTRGIDALEQSLEAETGLTFWEVRRARRQLRLKGLISEHHERRTHDTLFRLNVHALEAAWSEAMMPNRGAAEPLPGGRGALRGGHRSPPLNRNYIDYTQNTTERPPATQTTPVDSQGETPRTPLEALKNPMIQLFQQTCGRVPGMRDYSAVIELMRHVHAQHGVKTVDFLRPFWLAWSSRKRSSDGRPYDPSSLTWLSEWALNGQIPPTFGGANDRTYPGRSRGLAARTKNGQRHQPGGVAKTTSADHAAAQRIRHRRNRKMPLVS